jgi:hypothetical protein
MVAGRIRDHPAGAFVRCEQAEPVVGAAELERAATLERLGLEPDADADPLVQRRRLQQRRAVRDARQPGGRSLNPLERQTGLGLFLDDIGRNR